MGNRLLPVAGLSALAVGLIVAVISISIGEQRVEVLQIEGIEQVQELVGGIHQLGTRLGNDDAPITITVFNDIQIPSGAAYELEVVDPLIENYVRTSDVKLEFRNFPLGQKPVTVGSLAAVAAAAQDREWQFIELFVRNLDSVPAGGVDQQFLDEIVAAVPKIDTTAWEQDYADPASLDGANADADLATQMRLTADPAMVVDGPLKSVTLEGRPTYDEIVAAIGQAG